MSSQVRKHLKFTWQNYLRLLYNKILLGNLGKMVHISKNIEFLRFPKKIFIEDHVIIKEGVRMCACNNNAKISIGKRTTIGYHTFMFASNNIEIGDDCLIAPFVYLVDSDHQIKKGVNINSQPNVTSPIKIGNDVWIASNVTILKGVTIENGAIIAANSVLNQNVKANEIWGGSPAKKIRDRK